MIVRRKKKKTPLDSQAKWDLFKPKNSKWPVKPFLSQS